MSWRETSARVIAKCIAEHPEAGEREMRKIISAAYPFGERAMWPYKVWLTEVKRQMLHREIRQRQTVIFPAEDRR